MVAGIIISPIRPMRNLLPDLENDFGIKQSSQGVMSPSVVKLSFLGITVVECLCMFLNYRLELAISF